MGITHFGFAMDMVSRSEICTPGKIIVGFWRLLESHGRAIGADFDINTHGYNLDSKTMYDPSIYPAEPCRISLSFGSFNRGYGIVADKRSSTLNLDFPVGSGKINLYMVWEVDFFEGLDSIWRDYKDRFPPIRYKRRLWGSDNIVYGEVTMDNSSEYGKMFYARLSYDIAAYFWSVAEVDSQVPSEGTIRWGEYYEYGGVRFLD
jgi:hypothetical protein